MMSTNPNHILIKKMSKPNCEWKTSQFENFNTEWESFKQSDMLLESTHMQWLPINILALQCQQHCLL